MTKVLLAAAIGIAAVAVSVPAAAQDFRDSHHDRSSGHFASGESTCGTSMGRHGGRGGVRCGDVVMDVYGGEWALYNNRSWDPDSYNDWWHDRPNRAYPHWMTMNQDCQRRWYAGDVLRC
jgi:hypothetical protein